MNLSFSSAWYYKIHTFINIQYTTNINPKTKDRPSKSITNTLYHVGLVGKCTALLNRFPPFFSWHNTKLLPVQTSRLNHYDHTQEQLPWKALSSPRDGGGGTYRRRDLMVARRDNVQSSQTRGVLGSSHRAILSAIKVSVVYTPGM